MAGGSIHRHRSAEPTGGGSGVESAIYKGAVFGFIKLFAATKKAQGYCQKRFGAISEGTITAEQIDKGALIDTHYGAIAAHAMEQCLGI